MFVAEAHQRLRPSGDFGDGQSAVIQRFAHVQEDDGVHDVAEYLSADGVDGPLGQRKQAEVFLAGLPCSHVASSVFSTFITLTVQVPSRV